MAQTDIAARIDTLVTRMHAALAEAAEKGMRPPIERRRLKTLANECGQRLTDALLTRLEASFGAAGIYSEPPLGDASVRRDDWVLFSTWPFPADSLVFRKEKDLQRFIEACLGSGVFRNLEPFKDGNRVKCKEYRLPDGRRIDLLCQERTRSGNGAIVAVELKRERERGTVDQVIEYIDALRQLFPEREVKGLIISGREDQVGAAMISRATGYDIRWYCYKVTFSQQVEP